MTAVGLAWERLGIAPPQLRVPGLAIEVRTAPCQGRAREAAVDSTEDPELVARAQQRDEAAFHALVARYAKRAYWIAFHLVADEEDALDVAQEAFIRVFRAISSFDPRYKFSTWLYRIVTNLAVDLLRKRGAAKRLSLEEVGDLRAGTSSPREDLERSELRTRVDAVLADLPAKYRAIIVFRDIEGLSSKEIARIVGSTHATVRWRLHRARSLFRRAWEQRFGKSLEGIDLEM